MTKDLTLLVYRDILDDPSTPAQERPEAMGGVGRCFKQLYLLDQVESLARALARGCPTHAADALGPVPTTC